ncbi:hypothetical protein LSAT2_022936 [Lamellibrachia satsuma]|nr:hypothetical protein LSAT2_022936 [Lamellibrachia satsuma]
MFPTDLSLGALTALVLFHSTVEAADSTRPQQCVGKPNISDCMHSVGFLVLFIVLAFLVLLGIVFFVFFCFRVLSWTTTRRGRRTPDDD